MTQYSRGGCAPFFYENSISKREIIIIMVDWVNCVADENRILGTHYSKGRNGHAIKYIVIHHNAANLTFDDIVRVFNTREASAHYQVDAQGRICQLVWDADTAWHAGNWEANLESIGIEHANNNTNPYTVSPETLDAGAHLVAALCHFYRLGEPVWAHNVRPHQQITPTACPGQLSGTQNEEYMSKARQYYYQLTGTTQAAASTVSSFTPGAYRVTVPVLNVRNAPTTSSQIVAQYHQNETVNLLAPAGSADGYDWAQYTSYTGKTRYIALGTTDTQNQYLAKQ